MWPHATVNARLLTKAVSAESFDGYLRPQKCDANSKVIGHYSSLARCAWVTGNVERYTALRSQTAARVSQARQSTLQF